MEQNKWKKYNIPSPRPPDGKEGSTYYEILVKTYGEEKALILYKIFIYRSTHGG